MVRKGNLAIFEGSGISKTKETIPTIIDVHACYINTYLHEFFELIPIDLKRSKIFKTGEAMPINLGFHAFHINLFLHKFS